MHEQISIGSHLAVTQTLAPAPVRNTAVELDACRDAISGEAEIYIDP